MISSRHLTTLALALALALPQPNHAEMATGTKILIGLSACAIVGLIGYGLYEGLREKTDTEVLQSSETLCVDAHTNCSNSQLTYDKALALLEAEQAAVELKNHIYTSQCGNRYPLSSYIHNLDKVLTDIKWYLESLRTSNATLVQRKLRLLNAHNNKKMNADERTYLINEYTTQLTKVQDLEAILRTAQQNLARLKQNIASFPEYAQECLFARLDRLENKLNALELRPHIHTVYVHNNWSRDRRIDHLENKVDQLSSNCYQPSLRSTC